MSKLATTLRDEITRLARKEAKTQIASLRKANTQYRGDIASLKLQVQDLSRKLAFLEQQERKRVSKVGSEVSTEGKRFSRRGLITHRRKLGLSAADYGKLVGVSAQTIYSWENGKSKPRTQQLAALVATRNLRKREALKQLELLAG
jgi:DNA-binding XRE family transcriptional regulator